MMDYAKYKTDKIAHGYMPAYEMMLDSIRHERMNVLEIGIEGGHSMEMWPDFFDHPETRIAGLDLGDCRSVVWPKVTCFRGDMKDPAVIDTICAEFSPLHVIIDDASHLSGDSMQAFAHLFPRLSPGGFYIIEDIPASDMLGGFVKPKIIDGWETEAAFVTVFRGPQSMDGILFMKKKGSFQSESKA